MTDLTDEEKKALKEFQDISLVLDVPSEGKPLPNEWQWTLPDLDDKALDPSDPLFKAQSANRQQTPPAEASKTDKSESYSNKKPGDK